MATAAFRGIHGPATRMISVVIVDDEPLARRGIHARLRQLSDFDVIGECGSGQEAVTVIRTLRPDVVFLDIQMPDLDGFEVIEALQGETKSPIVIFVTAFDQHAIRAFQANALDYLLKPIEQRMFEQAVERARRRITEQRESRMNRPVGRAVSAGVENLHRMSGMRPTERFLVRKTRRIIVVDAGEIEWVAAAGDYVQLHSGVESYLLRETLWRIEKALDPTRFVRIHRSFIVRIDRIRELRPHFNREYIVVLADGTELKLSRGFRDRLEPFFGSEF